MLEKDIERYLTQEVKKRGGMCFKFVSPGNTGVPDRIVLVPGGKVVFVELKTATGRLQPIQRYMHREMRKRGAEVDVLYGLQGVETFLQVVMPCEV